MKPPRSMRWRYTPLYGFGKLVSCIVAKLLSWRSVVGREHWIAGPALIAANHASFLDPPFIGSACPEQIGYVARSDLFYNPLFGAICHGLGAIPIVRDSADFGSIKRVLAVLRRGRKVLLFPEGIRTFDGRMRPALPGVGLLVHRARVPVIPVYIHGSYRAWPRHRRLPVPARTVVVFGKPIRFDDYDHRQRTREMYREIADEIMAHIAALKPQAIAKL